MARKITSNVSLLRRRLRVGAFGYSTRKIHRRDRTRLPGLEAGRTAALAALCLDALGLGCVLTTGGGVVEAPGKRDVVGEGGYPRPNVSAVRGGDVGLVVRVRVVDPRQSRAGVRVDGGPGRGEHRRLGGEVTGGEVSVVAGTWWP